MVTGVGVAPLEPQHVDGATVVVEHTAAESVPRYPVQAEIAPLESHAL